MSGGFYITTPIFYVNDVPHIGHAYTEVAADVLARWHRQRGEDAFLLTGTDEHGQKIMRTAAANGVTPRAWTDHLVETAWKPLLQTLDIANDDFIRTTDERHETAVAKFFQGLYDAGQIYAGDFEGYYCVGCEEYKRPADLETPETGDFAGRPTCPIHGRPVEIIKETNYFFRMSDYQDRLLALYEERPDFIQPASLRNEIMQFVRSGLEDLSISRSTFDWGIKVPWDESHVIYVWVDALLNYITALGWGDDSPEFARHWPGTHLVGKDIARFHTVIWPAMLMAAGLEVPRGVFGHGWLLVGGEKMSKSKLTGIAPNEITDVFGSDAFRYYFLSAITFGQDGSFSWEDLSARYQAELANGLGNLASRVVAMVEKYFDGEVPEVLEPSRGDEFIQDAMRQAVAQANAALDRFEIDEALDQTRQLVITLNGYITDEQPWALAKDPAARPRLATVLGIAVQGLRTLAVLLAPVMPQATARLWPALGGEGEVAAQDIREPQPAGGGRVSLLDPPLFPRIEQLERTSD